MPITPLLNHCFYKCRVPLAIESAPGHGKIAKVTNWCENADEMAKWTPALIDDKSASILAAVSLESD